MQSINLMNSKVTVVGDDLVKYGIDYLLIVVGIMIHK